MIFLCTISLSAFANIYFVDKYKMQDTTFCSTCKKTKRMQLLVRFNGSVPSCVCKEHLECSYCKKTILPRDYIRTIGMNVFHANSCMYCSVCNRPCADKTARFSNNKLYCDDDAPCHFCDIKDENLKCRKYDGFWIKTHEKCVEYSKCRVCNIYLDLDSFNPSERGVHVGCKSKEAPCVVCKMPVSMFILETGKLRSSVLIYGKKYKCHDGCKLRNICGVDDCKNIALDPYAIFPKQWMCNNHGDYSEEIRDAIFTVLCAWKRKGTIFAILPRDVLYCIFRLIATLDGWSSFNTYNVNCMCTPWLCRMNKKAICRLCESPILTVHYPGSCSQDVCTKYAFKCQKCPALVPFDSDPITSCTMERCKYEVCSLCSGEIKYGEHDTRNNVCTKNECQFFTRRCNKTSTCGGLIRRSYLKDQFADPWDECTEYRCIKETCVECGSRIIPFANYVIRDGCKKDVCHTLENLHKSLSSSIMKFMKAAEYEFPTETFDVWSFSSHISDQFEVHILMFLSILVEYDDDERRKMYEKMSDIYKLWKLSAQKRFKK